MKYRVLKILIFSLFFNLLFSQNVFGDWGEDQFGLPFFDWKMNQRDSKDAY